MNSTRYYSRAAMIAALLACVVAACLAASVSAHSGHSLLPKITGHGGQKVTYHGVFNSFHLDDFKNRHAIPKFEINRRGKRPVNLVLDMKRLRMSGIGSTRRGNRMERVNRFKGIFVEIKGRKRGRSVIVTSIKGVRKPAPKLRASISGPKKVAVVLYNFTDDRSQPFTPQQAREAVFTHPTNPTAQDPGSVNEYFKEETGNALSLVGRDNVDGDVYGWIKINQKKTPCDSSTAIFDVGVKAAQQGINLSGYDAIIYISAPANCVSSGGPPYAVIYSGLHSGTLIHEMGHVFTMNHASRWDCAANGVTVTIAANANCTFQEYGDPYDAMGTGHSHNHGPHLTKLGTMPAANTTTASSFTSFTLKPSSQILTSGNLQVLRIPRTYDTTLRPYYYLEYRRPAGLFDAFGTGDPVVNGVTIRAGKDYPMMDDLTVEPTPENQTVILDATPETPGNDPLPVGGSFYDPIGNFTIKVTAADANGATVSYAAGPPVGSRSTVGVAAGVLTFNAAAGQANDVVVTKPTATTFQITDNGQPITANSPCTAVSGMPNQVTCPTSGVTSIRLNGNDANDHLEMKTSFNSMLDGGDGTDELVGNSATDTFTGGNGDDTISANDSVAEQITCGAGTDIVFSNSTDTFPGGSDCEKVNPATVSKPNWMTLRFQAGDNQANNVTITQSLSTITFSDSGAPVVAVGSGPCTTLATSVVCSTDFIQNVDVQLGNMNDTLAPNIGAPISANLGTGTDTFISGPETDTVTGDGGDTISYATRTSGVTVTDDSVANDGATGENDVFYGISTILGGSGNDTISGSATSQNLTIDGGAGNDTLKVGDSANTLTGGPGTDTLLARNNASDTLDCGADADSANIDGVDAPFPANCETILNAPDTTISSGPVAGSTIGNPSPQFSFYSDPYTTSFECRIDGFVWFSCGTPYVLAPLVDGNHSFSVRGVDPEGYFDVTPATRSFTVNSTAPDTTITSGPSGSVADTNPQFVFSANRADVTFECSHVNQGSPDLFTQCSSPATYSSLTDGTRVFKVRATDSGGLVDATPATSTYTVDTVGGNTVIDSGPPEGSDVNGPAAVTYTFHATEANSTFECRIDSGAFTACASPWTTPVLAVGFHSISIRSFDAAGNYTWNWAYGSFYIVSPPPSGPTVPTSAPVLTKTVGTFTSPMALSGASNELDWEHWGNSAVAGGSVPGLDRKSGATVQVSAYTKLPVGTSVGPTPVTTASPSFSWSGGTPTASHAGLATGNRMGRAAGRGFRVTAPATGGSARVLKLYVGVTSVSGKTTSGRLALTLSDGSATTSADTTISVTGASTTNRVYTVTYRTATAGATLQADWTQNNSTTNAGVGVRLYAAQLATGADATAADTSIISGPSSGSTITTSTAQFGLSSTEGGTQFYCNIDAVAWALCASPWTTPTLANGSHTVRFSAVDAQGNVDQTPVTRTFTKG